MARAAPDQPSPDQPSLFEAPPDLPPGMVYRPDFITVEAERELADWLAGLPFAPFQFQGYEGRRQVIYFGFAYDFSRSRLEETQPIPRELEPLRAQAAALAGLAPEELPHALINKYEPGAPIGWHRDRSAFDKVIGVSLLGAARFRMRRRAGDGFERKTINLAPRSAYLLAGPARYEWEHSIPPADQLRYSITFRSLRRSH